jgi:hypothetical protein
VNHPRGAGTTRLGAEEVGAVVAGVIRSSPRGIFFCWLWGFVAVGATAIHLRVVGATRLGAEEVGAVAAGVISGNPRCIFFVGCESL